MELELKHFLAYVDKGLKVKYKDSNYNKKHIATLSGVSFDGLETTYSRKFKGAAGDYIKFIGHNNIKDLELKPILRPLSDLTKEIEHNGETFIPIKILSHYANEQTEKGTTGLEWGIVSSFPYTDIEKLLEWKFDIFGLTENDLAVAVTDEFNPYK